MAEPLVNTDAAPAFQQRFGVGGDLFGGNARDGDIRRKAVFMLAVGRAAAAFIVAFRAVTAGDNDRLSKMEADFFQYFRQLRGDKYRVAAVAAGKLSHLEVVCERRIAVLCPGVDPYRGAVHVLSSCLRDWVPK